MTVTRVEICGGIASGKTTLAGALLEGGLPAGFENFALNPFVQKFYSDPAHYAFETETSFLLQHYSQIRDGSTQASGTHAYDFSLVLDMAYALVTLEERDRGAFRTVLDRSLQKIGLPSLIIRLRCDPAVELERIRRRRRAMEERITIDYLKSLEASIDIALGSSPFDEVPVIEIDSQTCDFRNVGADRGAVTAAVIDLLSRPTRCNPRRRQE